MNTVERILNLITERGITQKTLSNGTGITTGNITDWKSGKANPSYGAIVKIAKYFDVSEEYLQCKTDDPIPLNDKVVRAEQHLSPMEQKMLKMFDKADDKDKDMIIAMIEAAVKGKNQ